MAAAWHDVTGTRGWFKKALLLLLVGCVPLLNLAVEGYALRWARGLSFGRRSNLPDYLFERKVLSTGFFAWLVRIGLTFAYYMLAMVIVSLFAWAFGLVSAEAGRISFLVLLGVFVLLYVLVLLPVIDASVMRMAVEGYLEAGFGFPSIWRTCARDMGGLIVASLGPRLLVGVVELLLFVMLCLIAFLVVGADVHETVANPQYPLGYVMANSRALLGELNGAGIVNLLFLLAMIGVSSLGAAFSALLANRAVGHWAACTAPEWARESDDGQVAVRVDESGSDGFADDVSAWSESQHEPVGATGTEVVPDLTSQRQRRSNRTSKNDSGTTRLKERGPMITLVRKSNGRSYEVTAFPATIGKGSAATVRIENNNAISRTHVRIGYTGTSFVVEELGATNKTYLNGDFLAEGEIVILRDGDELKLAEEAFTVQIR